MTATILDRARRKNGEKPDPRLIAKDFLARAAKGLPHFVVGPERQYNGIVLHALDEDAQDILEALSSSGFQYEAYDIEDEDVLQRLKEAGLLSS
jgi:hypothetical protein